MIHSDRFQPHLLLQYRVSACVALVLSILLGLPGTVKALSAIGSGTASVGEYVTPHGALDLEALRNSGVQGSVDLSGFQISMNPHDGSVLATPQADGARAPGDENWWDGFGSPGLFEDVNALAVYNGSLVFGGDFTVAGGAPAQRIASWNGTSWSTLGTGMNGGILCLHVFAGRLIAGGWFGEAGGVYSPHIAQWDGISWTPVGTVLNGNVFALATYNGSLIAAGEFTDAGGAAVNHIARLSGSTWVPLGSGANANINGLTIFGTNLVAGGEFSQIGGLQANCIAKWNGLAWSAVGAWSWGGIRPMAVYQNQLYAATWGLIARLVGNDWVPIESPAYGGFETMLLYGGRLLVGCPGGQRIYAWDGSAWSSLGTGIGEWNVQALAEYNGRLYAGGRFWRAGPANVLNVASWDGSTWSGIGTPIGQGVGGFVTALAVFQGNVIAGGTFTVAGGVPANNVAAWDGSGWHPLAEGVTGNENSVKALIVYQGSLIVAGSFEYAGNQRIIDLARWNGNSWSSLAGGNNGGRTDALAIYHGDLIAAGELHQAGGVDVLRIARWDGFQWYPLGSGIDGCEVRALVVHGDDLIAGGCFTEAGGAPGNAVARWNGTTWSALGAGLSDVYALASYRGSLIAGGSFDMGGGVRELARWDGTSWGPCGGYLEGGVRSLAVIEGDLYAGGDTGYINGQPVNHIARFDGAGWSALGSGTNRSVLAIGEGEDPTGTYLFAGGEINWAGDYVPSGGIARWRLGASSRPAILSVTDIPNDQGRQVRLKWSRSKFDAPGQPVTITGYAVFREQGQNKAGRDAGRSLPGQGTPAAGGVRMEGWDYVMTVPAFGDSTYQCVAPTLCDSTITDGLCLSNFLIRATTSNPFDYYDSAPMSGYSVDNLAPSAPSNLRFQGPSTLVWDEVADPDFRFYAIYQSGNPVFDPQDTDLLGYSTTPAMDVSGAHERYLHVTATDFSGNEGRAGTISNPATDVAAGGAPPTRYALHAARPNPATESVVMGFDLPQAEDVWLRVFDVTGREAATLARGRFPAGVHTVIWDTREQGAQLPTGAYFCRLSAGSYSETQKVLLIRR